MAKQFDPLEYKYELIANNEGIAHFQKIIDKENPAVKDIIELSYWAIFNTWFIFIEMQNLKQFLPPDAVISDEHTKLPLFVGKILSAFEFELLMKRIVPDPKMIVQL